MVPSVCKIYRKLPYEAAHQRLNLDEKVCIVHGSEASPYAVAGAGFWRCRAAIWAGENANVRVVQILRWAKTTDVGLP